jgi:hypothetical protein
MWQQDPNLIWHTVYRAGKEIRTRASEALQVDDVVVLGLTTSPTLEAWRLSAAGYRPCALPKPILRLLNATSHLGHKQ